MLFSACSDHDVRSVNKQRWVEENSPEINIREGPSITDTRVI